MRCELCGKEAELFRTLVEDSELQVCKECSRFGRVLKKVSTQEPMKKVKTAEEPEIIEIIADDYSEKIRKAREKRGLKQEEFAKMLSEKESLLQKMETDKYKPSIAMARKMEKILRIKLVEEVKEEKIVAGKGREEGFTIGDVVKLRKR